MKLRSVLFAVAAVAVAGCALVIDLGEKAKLYPSEAGPVAPDTGPTHAPVADASGEAQADAAVDSGPPGPRCGLLDSPNAKCADCFATTECCEVNKTCAADPDCVAGLECIKDCVVNSPCIDQCTKDHPGIEAVTDCTIRNCFLCTPPSACVKLGSCIFALPKTSIVRQTYRNAILELDPQKCTDIRLQVVENGESDAAACY